VKLRWRETQLNLFSLEQRRVRGDLIEAFKNIKGIEKVKTGRVLLTMATATQLRGHNHKIYKGVSKKNCLSFVSKRLIDRRNRISSHAIDSTSVKVFRKRLDQHLKRNGQ
jgi:hypothetical protein